MCALRCARPLLEQNGSAVSENKPFNHDSADSGKRCLILLPLPVGADVSEVKDAGEWERGAAHCAGVKSEQMCEGGDSVWALPAGDSKIQTLLYWHDHINKVNKIEIRIIL